MSSRRSRSSRRAPTPQVTSPRRPRARWRRQLDSFGGPLVVGGIAATVVVVMFIAIRALPSGRSTASLLGEAVAVASASHVSDPSQLVIPEGQPPAGGPHFPVPQPPGVYDQPVADGNAIHSLEHGMVWISYRADLLAPGDLDTLKRVAKDFGTDVILSPRPANSQAVSVVSWGRRSGVATPVDQKFLRQFVETNRNRSPEPGLR